MDSDFSVSQVLEFLSFLQKNSISSGDTIIIYDVFLDAFYDCIIQTS